MVSVNILEQPIATSFCQNTMRSNSIITARTILQCYSSNVIIMLHLMKLLTPFLSEVCWTLYITTTPKDISVLTSRVVTTDHWVSIDFLIKFQECLDVFFGVYSYLYSVYNLWRHYLKVCVLWWYRRIWKYQIELVILVTTYMYILWELFDNGADNSSKINILFMFMLLIVCSYFIQRGVILILSVFNMSWYKITQLLLDYVLLM